MAAWPRQSVCTPLNSDVGRYMRVHAEQFRTRQRCAIMAGEAYKSKSALRHVAGSPGLVRLHPHRAFRLDTAQLAQLHLYAVREACDLSPNGSMRFVVDASRLRFENLKPLMLQHLHSTAEQYNLYSMIHSVVIEQPNVFSKAFQIVAKALQSPLCDKISLQSDRHFSGQYSSDSDSEDDTHGLKARRKRG